MYCARFTLILTGGDQGPKTEKVIQTNVIDGMQSAN
jgi:hypothetical protein